MKPFTWNAEKDQWLRIKRGIGFQQIVDQINNGYLIEITAHPNSIRYKNQRIFVIEWNNYAYMVPFIEVENWIFLKTIIPNRKVTKKYLRRKS